MEKIKGIIKACTDPKEWNGIIQIGFTLQENPAKWFNVDGEKEVLTELKSAVLSKGNEIEFEFEKGKVGSITLLSKVKVEEKNWAEDMTNFEDLLNAAHEKAFKQGVELNIETEVLRGINGEPMISVKDKTALFKATVTTNKSGKEISRFEAHGDATETNIGGEMIKPHFIRMAETRAIARALRWYTNNAKVAEEETSGEKKA